MLRLQPCTAILTTIACSTPLLFACTTWQPLAPLPHPPVPAPAWLAEPTDATQATHPAPTLDSAPLDLGHLLAYADAHAPALQMAQAQGVSSRVATVAALHPLTENPTLDLSTGLRAHAGAAALHFELAVHQSFPIAGQPQHRRDVATASAHADLAQIAEARWHLHGEVRRHCAKILGARERHATAVAVSDLATRYLSLLERSLAMGDTPAHELLLARAELALGHDEVVAAQDALRLAELELMALIGWPSHQPLPLDLPAPPIEVLAAAPETTADHPLLAARQRAHIVRRHELALADSRAWPDPTIGLGYAHEGSPGPEDAAHTWLLHLGLPLPLWDRHHTERAQAEVALHVAAWEEHTAATALRDALLQSYQATNAAALRVQRYERDILPLIEEHLAALERAVALGDSDTLLVFQGQQRLLTALSQHGAARAAYFEARAHLEALLGADLHGEPLP